MAQSRKKMWLMLLVISFGGSIIYIFPYLQYTFYDSMMAELNFTHTQMGNIMSIYGALNLIAYFMGGIIADRFSSRKLITFSLVVTGITGFWFATFPSYISMMVISVIWSFTKFSHTGRRLLRQSISWEKVMYREDFCFREALNSLGALIFSSTAMWIFTKSGENFKNVVIFYSIVYVVIGIVSFIFLPHDGGKEGKK